MPNHASTFKSSFGKAEYHTGGVSSTLSLSDSGFADIFENTPSFATGSVAGELEDGSGGGEGLNNS